MVDSSIRPPRIAMPMAKATAKAKKVDRVVARIKSVLASWSSGVCDRMRKNKAGSDT